MKRYYRNPRLTLYKPQAPASPNAADNCYFANKALDILTAIVSGIGFTTALMFLITLG